MLSMPACQEVSTKLAPWLDPQRQTNIYGNRKKLPFAERVFLLTHFRYHNSMFTGPRREQTLFRLSDVTLQACSDCIQPGPMNMSHSACAFLSVSNWTSPRILSTISADLKPFPTAQPYQKRWSQCKFSTLERKNDCGGIRKRRPL